MARITNPTTKRDMGRDRISSPSKDIVTKSGTALFSIVNGEQLHINMTAAWMTSLSGCTITAKVVEAENDGSGTIPTTQASTPTVTALPLIDTDITDNKFKLVFPEDLISSWAVQPSPDKPVYGFIGVEIADSGIGDLQQKWKPVRGLVEILYSPSEA